jgi:hypothetical protein
VDRGSLDDVVVVERHDHRAGEDVEIVDEADQDLLGRHRGAGLELGGRVEASVGCGGLDRRDQVDQKALGVGVARVESQPSHPALGCDCFQPLREERGLAEPRRRRDEDQARLSPSVRGHQIDETGARHEPTTRRGPMQLGAQ